MDSKDREKNYRARKIFKKICPKCHKEYQTQEKRQKHCSRSCAATKYMERLTMTKICLGCGKEFAISPERYHRFKINRDSLKYCSRECAFRYTKIWHKHGLKERKQWPHSKIQFGYCGFCGNLFLRRHGRKYCSPLCAYKAGSSVFYYTKWAHIKSIKEINPYIKKKCKSCGKEFEINFQVDAREYCSKRCARRLIQQRRNYRERTNYIEDINIMEIYFRDNGRCGICGKKIKYNLPILHPKALTLDHIIPIAKGGEHSKKNVQVAHRICNSIKRDQLNVQQRLFG